jgi:hypothetical protein
MAVSPLLGYNTNVRHHGKVYHIQTEDSGATHGHIFTHLFADGGRIIASKKTTYKEHVGSERYPDIVKKLMRESHKTMFIALRDGLFDEDEAAGARAIAAIKIGGDGSEGSPAPAAAVVAPPAAPRSVPSSPALDIDALERAAAAKLAQAEAQRRPSTPAARPEAPPTAGRYGPTRPAVPVTTTRSSRPAARRDPSSESIFGGDLLSEKSLDEVILSYLAEDADD